MKSTHGISGTVSFFGFLKQHAQSIQMFFRVVHACHKFSVFAHHSQDHLSNPVFTTSLALIVQIIKTTRVKNEPQPFVSPSFPAPTRPAPAAATAIGSVAVLPLPNCFISGPTRKLFHATFFRTTTPYNSKQHQFTNVPPLFRRSGADTTTPPFQKTA